MPHVKTTDAYIIDTCKIADKGTFVPGAITYAGRKKTEVIQWKDKEFPTQEEADAFVREHFVGRNIPEAGNEGELRSA